MKINFKHMKISTLSDKHIEWFSADLWVHLLRKRLKIKQTGFLVSSLNLANFVEDERPQSCGYDVATPDRLQFSARHQTPAARKHGQAITRLQEHTFPKTLFGD